ncbi:TPA: hypothetical protein OTY75_002617 [Enterococcus faecium]|nr:hypothetical protein [Enterococcus faecium]HCT4850116.1 hypothetical protein [Enterococcus faecium]HCT4875781.1 hypothetical protein [Enterococcus faecium]
MIDYNDRGRLKWAGFYLSDHTEEIDADNEQRANNNLAKEQMTTEEIAEVLNAAVIKNRSVSIQKEERNAEGYYPEDIIGKIKGFDELGIYIEETKIGYDEIRNVCLYSHIKWQSSKEF